MDRSTILLTLLGSAMAAATADEPGPAAIGKYVAPLVWFRWGAVA